MGNVIQLPTVANLTQEFRQGSRVKSKAVGDSIMLVVGEVELWLPYEQAAVVLDDLSEALLDAWVNIKRETEEAE